MPFATLIRITTQITPEIDPPPVNATSFWINVGGNPFQFHVTGTDLAGQQINFLAPMIFVSLSETHLDNVAAEYVADAATRRCAARGQKVAYADPAAGDTVLKTGAFYFSAQLTGEQAPYPVAPFLPALDNAEVTIPSLAEILGQQTAVLIGLYPPYLAAGLDPNAGVFAEIDGTQPTVGFNASRSGGFAQPNIVAVRAIGPQGAGLRRGRGRRRGQHQPGSLLRPHRREALRDRPARNAHPGRRAEPGQRGAERPRRSAPRPSRTRSTRRNW